MSEHEKLFCPTCLEVTRWFPTHNANRGNGWKCEGCKRVIFHLIAIGKTVNGEQFKSMEESDND